MVVWSVKARVTLCDVWRSLLFFPWLLLFISVGMVMVSIRVLRPLGELFPTIWMTLTLHENVGIWDNEKAPRVLEGIGYKILCEECNLLTAQGEEMWTSEQLGWRSSLAFFSLFVCCLRSSSLDLFEKNELISRQRSARIMCHSRVRSCGNSQEGAQTNSWTVSQWMALRGSPGTVLSANDYSWLNPVKRSFFSGVRTYETKAC